jgi:hypothetical protein
VEGSDAECQTHRIEWAKLTGDSLQAAIDTIEEEADKLWNEANAGEEPDEADANSSRAKSIADLLPWVKHQWDQTDEDDSTVLVDMLANMQHFCTTTSIDFDNTLRIARMHFQSEEGPALKQEGSLCNSRPHILAVEVYDKLHSVGEHLQGHLARLLGCLLHEKAEELQAPLDETEQEFYDIVCDTFDVEHPFWSWFSITKDLDLEQFDGDAH